MAKFDELLASLTPDDGIREDFIEGVKLAYNDDMNAVKADYDSQIADMASTHEAAISELNANHASELEAAKSQKFDEVLDPNAADALPETFGNEQDELTFENYWVENTPGKDA